MSSFADVLILLLYFLSSGVCNIKVKQLLGPFTLGEGPHWDSQSNVLIFVDIDGKTVNRYNPATGDHKYIKLEKNVSPVVPVKGSSEDYIIGHGLDLSHLHWDGQGSDHCVQVIQSVEADKPENRFNDGKADRQGNLWIGTMHQTKEQQGALYKYSDANGTLTIQQQRVGISNGIAWSKDNTQMFFIDSLTRRVDVFRFDTKTSTICCREGFFDLKENGIPGFPDGMTIDNNDNLWVAVWGGRRVLNINGKTGKLLRTIRIPVEQVTSVVFGGVDLKTLYVTTARKGTPKQIEQDPLSGYVFAVEGLGVTGTHSNTVNFVCCS